MLITDRQNLNFDEMERISCDAYSAGALLAVTPRFDFQSALGCLSAPVAAQMVARTPLD
jgi:hypothetical protein